MNLLIHNETQQFAAPNSFLDKTDQLEMETSELPTDAAVLFEVSHCTFLVPELPADETPILDKCIVLLTSTEDTVDHTLADAITEFVGELDFDKAREVELTLITIGTLEDLIAQTEDISETDIQEISQKLEESYEKLALQLGLEIADDEMIRQFKELLHTIVPNIITDVYMPHTRTTGTHEFLLEDIFTGQYLRQVISIDGELFHAWLGRYILQLARTLS